MNKREKKEIKNTYKLAGKDSRKRLLNLHEVITLKGNIANFNSDFHFLAIYLIRKQLKLTVGFCFYQLVFERYFTIHQGAEHSYYQSFVRDY